jgi:hypothetical protein
MTLLTLTRCSFDCLATCFLDAPFEGHGEFPCEFPAVRPLHSPSALYRLYIVSGCNIWLQYLIAISALLLRRSRALL